MRYYRREMPGREFVVGLDLGFSKVVPGVTGKFGLGVRNKAGQRLIEFCQENALVPIHVVPFTWVAMLCMR